MARVLVTGGAGYVGSVCSAELISQGHSVVVIDNLSAGHRHALSRPAAFYEGDIGDTELLRHVIDAHGIDAVFHFAAKALIPESVIDPAPFFRVNVISAFAMLEVLRAWNVKKFVFSSTAAVYGIPTALPIDEEAAKLPVNSYGESKLVFERILASYASAYDLSVVAFRYFNASGAAGSLGEDHRPETHIIPLLLDVASDDRSEFTIYGDDYATPDGTCLRDYVHVLDIARAHVLALNRMDRPGFSAYNIGTGASYSVLEVCATVSEVTGKHIPLRTGSRRLGDPAVLCADPRKLVRELGWAPENSSLKNIVETAWRHRQSLTTSQAMEGAMVCEVDA